VGRKLSISVKSDAGYGSDEISLGFGYAENENGAMKLFSKVLSAPSLYMAAESDYLSVRYLTNTNENPIAPLIFTPGMDGTYTIYCNFDPGIFETVMLEDRQTHNIQNMKAEKTYHFNASKGDDANRFVLYFGPVYTDGIGLIVDLTLISKETDIFVYDIMGRLLLHQQLQGEIKHDITINNYTQMLVVYLTNPDGNLSCKLLWGR
jgi:hypothetical protein